jgi:transposase
MAQARLPMRKIKEVLRLRYEHGISQRQIAASCGIAQSTVIEYLRRAQAAGLGWPLPGDLSEAALEDRLFHNAATPPERPLPDFQHVHDELRRHRRLNLTLMQLWSEYREQYADGYEYTQFCEHYRRWRGKLDYVMRQEHRAGEKVFVDYGDGIYITDPDTGVLTMTQLFVGVWGLSNYTYAEASLSQELSCWIGSHVRAFTYFGCAPLVLVPDNLKAGVSKTCRYDPEINPTYAELSAHYGTAVMPTRVRKPRDKAKVEAGVLVAKRWILSVLRNRVFFSLGEMNAAIRELLENLNARKLRKLQKSRRELFESQDRPSALALPERAYQFAEWYKPRVNINYHVDVERHCYSVPCRLLNEILDIRLTATTFEAFHRGERVAAHVRSSVVGGYTTLSEHMPSEHRKYAEWTPSRIIAWTGKAGAATTEVAGKILASKSFPEQGYKACLGLMRLGERHGAERLEAACRRALSFNTCAYRSIKAILARGLDRQAEPEQSQQTALPFHENVRGREYYH